MFTKYDHWRYEEEIRLWARLKERTGDYYFQSFNDETSLEGSDHWCWESSFRSKRYFKLLVSITTGSVSSKLDRHSTRFRSLKTSLALLMFEQSWNTPPFCVAGSGSA